jgi:hypothetical protein
MLYAIGQFVASRINNKKRKYILNNGIIYAFTKVWLICGIPVAESP